MVQRTLNLGIVAHVDAGKTTLTERLLFAAGAIDALGSVDGGTTQTDTLALERQRGITIRSAVASFAIDDVAVNLIDTPGHPDFIAEVERVLGVLDGAVLVVSAVEGVQAQTRLLFRALQRLGVPTLIFVNKIDRPGADAARVLLEIAEKLTASIAALGTVEDAGTPRAAFVPGAPTDADFRTALARALAEHDESLLAAYVEDETDISYERLRGELERQARLALVHPLLFGSARTGAGIHALTAAVVAALPSTGDDREAPVSGSIFKIERGPAAEKVALLRMFTGAVHTREVTPFGKVTALSVFDRGRAVARSSVGAGQIARVWGLADARVGDTIGESGRARGPVVFAPPTLETAVVPVRPDEKARLHASLAQLAEQDPLINLRQDDVRQELFLSLYGEVQKEVIRDTLVADFGLEVEFRETTPICIERVVGVGLALQTLGDPSNPYLATVGLRVEPAPAGSGVSLALEVDLRSVPLYVYKSVEHFREALETACSSTLERGPQGWRVTDCAVTLTDSGYSAPGTGAGDFRKLTDVVLSAALREAGTVVCEPVLRFHLDGPAGSLQAATRALGRLGIGATSSAVLGSTFALEGLITAARAHLLQEQVRGLTHGEGVLELVFDHYAPVG